MPGFLLRLGCWPNVLTFVRISCVPAIIICYYLPLNGHKFAALLFILAASTDWLDGYLARQLQQVSKLGAFLDPVADKLLVCVALLLILGGGKQNWSLLLKHYADYGPIIATVPVICIVCREIIISALREWMAQVSASECMAVSHWGKLKTVVQMLAVAILLSCERHSSSFMWYLGYGLLYIAALLALLSMWLYFCNAFSKMCRNY